MYRDLKGHSKQQLIPGVRTVPAWYTVSTFTGTVPVPPGTGTLLIRSILPVVIRSDPAMKKKEKSD
jgi:hypothetical protein